MNADTFLSIPRIPIEGENLVTESDPVVDLPGGKGCNQAIASSKLSSFGIGKKKAAAQVSFVGKFGNDEAATMLRETLLSNNVDITFCGEASKKYPSGRGYVFLQTKSGKVSAVVSPGSNIAGWDEETVDKQDTNQREQPKQEELLTRLISNDETKVVLLQCEIPEKINLKVAQLAKKQCSKKLVLLDVGGEDRPMSKELMGLCDYLIPNRTELDRLVHSLKLDNLQEVINAIRKNGYIILHQENSTSVEGDDYDQEQLIEHVILYAQILQHYGDAQTVLVTLGEDGSILVPKKTSDEADIRIIHQPACQNIDCIDETGAGDCYRAAFAAGLTANNDGAGEDDIKRCMQFASAAGALATTRQGAVPSIPSKEDVIELCQSQFGWTKDENIDSSSNHNNGVDKDTTLTQLRGGDRTNQQYNVDEGEEEDFPLLFGSRLNSMKDRPELWEADDSTDSRSDMSDWIHRMGTIRGLGCVDFNYPQHFHKHFVSNAEAKKSLCKQNLVAGAVCLRYPSSLFVRGAMMHPDPALRQKAIDLTMEAAQTARELNCNEVVIWSAYDGYDYPFQINYDENWQHLIDAFQQCCDAYPDIKFSLEFKPTDENTRFFCVPSTGAALLFVNEVNRSNMGLTLDVGHMLMAGENPGQSIAMVGASKKLFGIQLNDGYTRLAAEDGMMFGSVHPYMALEIMYYLQKVDYQGHLYFDTFPQRTDPVKEAEFNIQRVKMFWKAAKKLKALGIDAVMDKQDAIGALNLSDEALMWARQQQQQGTQYVSNSSNDDAVTFVESSAESSISDDDLTKTPTDNELAPAVDLDMNNIASTAFSEKVISSFGATSSFRN